MNKNRIDKKGEVTTQQLVILLVLIASFVIILILFFRLNLGEQTDKEICRNSVVVRDKTVGWIGSVDCKTNYICVSGGSDCDGLSSSSNVKVDASNKEAIMKILADEMSDCWWQFGEGNTPRYGPSLSEDKVHYALCSVVEFDNNVNEKYPQISLLEFYNYLEKTPKDNSQSYLKYLYETSDLNLLKTEDQINVNLQTDLISTGTKYSIITGLDRKFFYASTRDDLQLKVYIIPTSETSSRLIEDSQFMTKA